MKGHGLGRKLVQEMLKHIKEKGMTRIHLHARYYAIPFYQKMGFQEDVSVPRFTEINMEHAEMFMNL